MIINSSLIQMDCSVLNIRFVAAIFALILSFTAKGQPTPPYSVCWIKQIGVSTNGSVLTKTGSTGAWSNGGAISSNLLLGNTDGWLEFTAVVGADYMVGWGTNDLINYNEFSHSIHIDDNTNTAIAHEGGSNGISFGAFQTGDVFRISREANEVKYYKNGSLLRTVTVNPALNLKVKACMQVNGKSTPQLNLSFDCTVIVQSTITATDGNAGNGSIVSTAYGAAAPYTYSWSSGEQAHAISNKPHGTYTLTATDGLGREQVRTYTIGYKINWVNQVGVSTNGSIITKTAQSGRWSDGGAISSNLLPSNTDGWMEFMAVTGADYIVGLTANNIINYHTFSLSLHIDAESNIAYAREGASEGVSLGSFETGDVFRISREGNVGKYYKNGTVVRTVALSSALELKVKGTLQDNGKSTPQINTSFDCRLIVVGNVTGLNGNSGAGTISVNASGGTSPYVFNWSTNESTNVIANKPKGTYSVTVTDAIGRQMNRTYTIGYNVNWTNQIGVSTSGSILTKTALSGRWDDGGAVSSNILPANTDGWIEFTGINGADYRIGLSTNDVINYSTFNYSMFIDNEPGIPYASEGASSVSLGNFQSGDLLKISREGNVVKYLRNGTVLRTVGVNPSLVLKVKASIQNKGYSSPNITTSFWNSDGVVRTYYSIASGNWTTPSIWSLSENGPPSTVYPDDIDKVVIKGHEVTISSDIKSAGITISSTNENTKLKVDGAIGVLTVKGNILMNRENVANTAGVLVVQNNAQLIVQ